MSAIRTVLTSSDLLYYIGNFNTDDGNRFIVAHRNFGLKQRWNQLLFNDGSVMIAVQYNNIEALMLLNTCSIKYAYLLNLSPSYPYYLSDEDIVFWLGNDRGEYSMDDVIEYIYVNSPSSSNSADTICTIRTFHSWELRWDDAALIALRFRNFKALLFIIEHHSNKLLSRTMFDIAYRKKIPIDEYDEMAKLLMPKLSNTVLADLALSAVMHDKLHILQAIQNYTNYVFEKNIMDKAVDKNNLELVKWLHTVRTQGCTTQAMDNAAERGMLETVKWLYYNIRNSTEVCTPQAMNGAAANGHLNVVEWLHYHLPDTMEHCTADAMDWAAGNGHLAVVKFLHYNIFTGTKKCTTNAMDYAAKHGYFDVVKFLHYNRTEGCTDKAISYAMENGHVRIVHFLYKHRKENPSDLKIQLLAAIVNIIDFVTFGKFIKD